MPKPETGAKRSAPESAAMLGAPETTAVPAPRRKVLPSDPDPIDPVDPAPAPADKQ